MLRRSAPLDLRKHLIDNLRFGESGLEPQEKLGDRFFLTANQGAAHLFAFRGEIGVADRCG